jgi:hypothetical protein
MKIHSRSLRYYSNWAHAIQVTFVLSWLAIPDDLRAVVPTWLMVVLAVTIFLLGFLGTNIKQNLKRHDDVSKPSGDDPHS